MGVYCEILIKTPSDGVHQAGKIVEGVVKYAVDKPMKCKDIVLSLIGRGQVRWTESSNKTSITYRGKEKYVSVHKSLLIKKNEDEIITIPIGSFEYPFEFVLPVDIPSTYKNSKHRTFSEIKYYVKLKFMTPGLFSFNKKFKRHLIVNGYVNAVHPDIETSLIFGLEKKLFSFSSIEQHINLKCEIYKTLFAPGDTAILNMTVNNNSNVKITAIRTEIVCATFFTADCGKKKKDYNTIKESILQTHGINENDVISLSTAVTCLPELYSIQNSRIINRNYSLKVTLRLPIPYINSSVELPIVIGKKVGTEGLGVCANDEQIFDEEPPPYWEIMNEYKSDKTFK